MLRFPGQRKDEEVLAFVYKHWIVFTRIIISFGLVIFFPLFLFLYFWFLFNPLSDSYQTGIIIGIFSCIYLLFALLFMCIRWLNEEFDIFILTNHRLIDITQISFLKRSVTSTPLEQIQDTTGAISGFLGTMLHYGDLEVQTAAGEASDFSIDSIPEPESVAQKILDLADKRRKGQAINPATDWN